MRQIETHILEEAVEGRNLRGSTLSDELQGGPTVVVFLRHFG